MGGVRGVLEVLIFAGTSFFCFFPISKIVIYD